MTVLLHRQLRRLSQNFTSLSFSSSAYSFPIGPEVPPDFQRLSHGVASGRSGAIVADVTYDPSVEDILIIDDIPPEFPFCRLLSANRGDQNGSLTLLSSLNHSRYSAATVALLEAQFGVSTLQCNGPDEMTTALRKRNFDKIVINFPHVMLPKKSLKFTTAVHPEEVLPHGRKSTRERTKPSTPQQCTEIVDSIPPSLSRYLTATFATARTALRHPHGELHLRLPRRKILNRPGRALERAVYHSGLELIRTINGGSALSRLSYRPKDLLGKKIDLDDCLTLVFAPSHKIDNMESHEEFLGKSLLL